MAEIERKDETKMRKERLNYIYSSLNLLRSLSTIDGEGSISRAPNLLIHFWELSIIYYLVKMSFQC